ncbi:MAG: TetR/AcrR family transcriptional regulator [Chloroflexi bacterium]|nr:TetR/AcrR family transcriptional regulator [Chloroflexota bacterium]
MVEVTRRRAIEDVASELFRAHGYAATSVRDIARALDIQGPSLYAHVTSKEDVLRAIVDRAATRFEQAADAALATARAGHSAALDPAAALAALVRAHVRVITDDVGTAGVFVHEWRALTGERRAGILERRDAYEARFRDLVTDGIATGDFELTDPAVAAKAILGMLNALSTWYSPDGRLPAGRIADHLADLVLRMLQGGSR